MRPEEKARDKRGGAILLSLWEGVSLPRFAMRLKWLALTFILGLIVILDPTQTPAQPGGRGGFGKGGFNKGDGNGPRAMGASMMLAPGGAPAPGGPPGNGFQFPQGNPGGGFPQPGGFGGGRGGGGNGRGGMNGPMNPEMMWQVTLSRTGGNPNSTTADLSLLPQSTRDRMRQQAETYGLPPLPEGVVTKEQYLGFITAASAAREQQTAAAMQQNGGPQMPPGNWNQWGQGPGQGPENLENGGNGERGNRDRRNKEEEEKPMVALRYGKLPKDVPSWFEEYDFDKDGQIALWEWRKAGQPIWEFEDYDLNKDGFITPDEYIRALKAQEEAKKLEALKNGDDPRGGRGNRGRGGDQKAAAEGQGGPPGPGGKGGSGGKMGGPGGQPRGGPGGGPPGGGQWGKASPADDAGDDAEPAPAQKEQPQPKGSGRGNRSNGDTPRRPNNN